MSLRRWTRRIVIGAFVLATAGGRPLGPGARAAGPGG